MRSEPARPVRPGPRGRVFRRSLSAAALILLAAPLSAAHAQGTSPSLAGIERQIRAPKLEPERAVPVQDVRLDLHLGSLTLESGFLVPASPVVGRTCEVVFVGEARFALEPPDALEGHQLELFTRERRLEEKVRAAVLVVGSGALIEKILARPPTPPPGDRLQEAEATYREWCGSPVRKGPRIASALAKIALGDGPYQSFFAVWCRSRRLGDFYYRFDPEEIEQIGLGQYVPAELGAHEEDTLRRAIRRERRKGRFLELDPEDWGDWDTWISSSDRDAAGNALPGGVGFEPARYTIEVTVVQSASARDALEVKGKARLELQALRPGHRMVPLDLFSDLTVTGVIDGEGRKLEWQADKGRVLVVLPEATRAGDRILLEVGYGGLLFDKVEPGVYVSRETVEWYPRCGTVNRAPYDLTFRWPKNLDVVAPGRRVEGGEKEGMRWERRTLDVPAYLVSFELGNFDLVQRQVGHVELTTAFGRGGRSKFVPRAEVVSLIADALGYFEKTFGAYPLDQLTVATIPREFSQGTLGLVTLSRDLLEDLPDGFYIAPASGDLEDLQKRHLIETIAHEISHQWWGNKVGWWSYRDQWLSEALADFSAVLFTAQRSGKAVTYLTDHAKEWRQAVDARAANGRALADMGAVVLGHRLYSSRSYRAYSTLVYDKGSVVFSMLAKAFGEQAFAGMLRSLADAASNRPVDTATFIKGIERMSGADLGGFAREFVHGVGVPRVHYRYGFRKGDAGKWVVEGEATALPAYHEIYRLIRTDAGSWDVAREYRADADPGRATLVVPVQIALQSAESEQGSDAGAKSRKPARTSGYETARGLGGRAVLRGENSPFKFEIDREPREFWLDRRGEVFASFLCEDRYPKAGLRMRAEHLAEGGRHDPAEALYRKALEAPFFGSVAPEKPLPERDRKQQERLEDVDIHLGLCRLYLDKGHDADAEKELGVAEDLLPALDEKAFKLRRIILKSRLDLRQGNAKAAYERLSDALQLYFPQRESDSTAEQLRRRKFSENPYIGTGEAYALLAAAACSVGQKPVCDRAIREAERRDADVEALKEADPANR